MIDEDAIRRRFEAMRPQLDERGRLLSAAAAVRAMGHAIRPDTLCQQLVALGYSRQVSNSDDSG